MATTKDVKEMKTKTVIIPVDKNDPDGFVPICINGVVTTIKRGVEVEVKENVYEILKESGYLGLL